MGAAETVRQWVRKAPGASAPSAASVDASEVVRRLLKEIAELNGQMAS